MQWLIKCTQVEYGWYKSISTKHDNVRAKRAKNMDNFNHIYHELRPLFQQCNNLFRSRGETSGSQVILCTLQWSSIGTNVGTEKIVYGYVRQYITLFTKITIILLGARGEAPKSQAIWSPHWSQIDTNRHRKDSVRVARQTFQRFNRHISHEMPLFW